MLKRANVLSLLHVRPSPLSVEDFTGVSPAETSLLSRAICPAWQLEEWRAVG